jgi:Protein of unknown function (DUF3303)
MLFAVMYTGRNVSEESQKRSLNLFTKWQPPAGYEFKAHYATCDGGGGIAIAEASSAEALIEAHSPWAPFFEFKTIPIVDIQQAVPIFTKTNAWRDSIK